MPNTIDLKKPYLRVKDFNTGFTTLEQDGKKFSEQGYPLLAPPVPIKYPCPKCDYGTIEGAPLLAHAAKVHQASEDMVECFKTYVQNIDRDLPHNEGIDWHVVEVVRSPAQLAMDEAENGGSVAAQTAPSAPRPVSEPSRASLEVPSSTLGLPADKKAPIPCPHCPGRTFKGKFALDGHMKMHAPKNSTRDDRRVDERAAAARRKNV